MGVFMKVQYFLSGKRNFEFMRRFDEHLDQELAAIHGRLIPEYDY